MKSLSNEKGQSLVEFTIILPVLLLLVMGIIQFGLIFNSYITVANASREGARAGISGNTDTQIIQLIKATSPNLNENNLAVTISPSENNRRSGDTLMVRVSYSYQLTIPIISKLFNNQVVLNGQTSMRVE